MAKNQREYEIKVTIRVSADSQTGALRVVEERLEIGLAKDEHVVEIKSVSITGLGEKR